MEKTNLYLLNTQSLIQKIGPITKRLKNYPYLNPNFVISRKADAYLHLTLITPRYKILCYLREDTTISSLVQLQSFLEDYQDGLYEELSNPFKFCSLGQALKIHSQSIKKIYGLHFFVKSVLCRFSNKPLPKVRLLAEQKVKWMT